jgi:hypothetical protein
MSPEELATQEAKADRFLKRGDFLRALAVLKGIVAEHPERSDLSERVQLIAESLHPSELQHASAPMPEIDVAPPTSPEEEGERLFQKGDYAGAAMAYRRALEAKPTSELIKERLVELFQLAQAQHGNRNKPAMAPVASPTARSGPGAMPAVPMQMPPRPPAPAATATMQMAPRPAAPAAMMQMPTAVAVAPAAMSTPPLSMLPPEERLRALLSRISERRRR